MCVYLGEYFSTRACGSLGILSLSHNLKICLVLYRSVMFQYPLPDFLAIRALLKINLFANRFVLSVVDYIQKTTFFYYLFFAFLVTLSSESKC